MKTLPSRIGSPVVLLVVLLALATGCKVGEEGERCNPDLSHDECNSGLSCQQPVNCPENYCCPTSGSGSNPYCQPGCNGGQASICAAGGDAECWQLEDGGHAEPSSGDGSGGIPSDGGAG